MALMQAGPQLGQAPAYPAVGTGTGVHLALFFRLSSTLNPKPYKPFQLPGIRAKQVGLGAALHHKKFGQISWAGTFLTPLGLGAGTYRTTPTAGPGSSDHSHTSARQVGALYADWSCLLTCRGSPVAPCMHLLHPPTDVPRCCRDLEAAGRAWAARPGEGPPPTSATDRSHRNPAAARYFSGVGQWH